MIYFRVWCKNKKEWEKDFVALTPEGRLVDVNRNMMLQEKSHLVEFGIKANNQIYYHGDILSYDCGDGDKTLKTFEFLNGKFITQKIGGSCEIDDSPLQTIKMAHLVGNIHYDSELLETK